MISERPEHVTLEAHAAAPAKPHVSSDVGMNGNMMGGELDVKAKPVTHWIEGFFAPEEAANFDAMRKSFKLSYHCNAGILQTFILLSQMSGNRSRMASKLPWASLLALREIQGYELLGWMDVRCTS